MIGRLFCLLIIGFLLFTVDGLGQNTWVKTYGGSLIDKGVSIVPTNDGGCVVTGVTSSNDGDFSGMNKGFDDIFVMKLKLNGDIVWINTFGGSEGRDNEKVYSITSTFDGGYILTGFTSSNDGDFSGMNKGGSDIFVIKLNSSGKIVWKKIFGGSGYECGFTITTISDGGYMLTGETSSYDGDFTERNNRDTRDKNCMDIFVIKLKSNGDIDWKKTFGGSNQDWGRSMISTPDGGCILTIITYSNDGDFIGMRKYDKDDILVVKLNSNGKIIWRKMFGGSKIEDVSRLSITISTDGGYVLTGYTKSNDGDFTIKKGNDQDIFVIKLNSIGDVQWKKRFGGSSYEYSHSITTSKDGGYVITGGTFSNDGDFSGMKKSGNDIFVIKLNSKGVIVWKNTFVGDNVLIGNLTQTKDDGYVMTGGTYYDNVDFGGVDKKGYGIFVMKLDKYGNLDKK